MQTAAIEYILSSQIRKEYIKLIPLDFVMFQLNSGNVIYQKDTYSGEKWSVLKLEVHGNHTQVKELYKISIGKSGKFSKLRRSTLQIHRFIANRLYPAYYFNYFTIGQKDRLSFYLELPEDVFNIFKKVYGKNFAP